MHRNRKDSQLHDGRTRTESPDAPAKTEAAGPNDKSQIDF
jgi:hypothetical protein